MSNSSHRNPFSERTTSKLDVSMEPPRRVFSIGANRLLTAQNNTPLAVSNLTKGSGDSPVITITTNNQEMEIRMRQTSAAIPIPTTVNSRKRPLPIPDPTYPKLGETTSTHKCVHLDPYTMYRVPIKKGEQAFYYYKLAYEVDRLQTQAKLARIEKRELHAEDFRIRTMPLDEYKLLPTAPENHIKHFQEGIKGVKPEQNPQEKLIAATEEMLAQKIAGDCLMYRNPENGKIYRFPIEIKTTADIALRNHIARARLAHGKHKEAAANLIAMSKSPGLEPQMMKIGIKDQDKSFINDKVNEAKTLITDVTDKFTTSIRENVESATVTMKNIADDVKTEINTAKVQAITALKDQVQELTTFVRTTLNSFGMLTADLIDKIVAGILTLYNIAKVPSHWLRFTVALQYLISVGLISTSYCFNLMKEGLVEFLDLLVQSPVLITGSLFYFFISVIAVVLTHTLYPYFVKKFKTEDKNEIADDISRTLVAQSKNEFEFAAISRWLVNLKNTCKSVEYFSHMFWVVFSWSYNALFGHPFVSDHNKEWINQALAYINEAQTLVKNNSNIDKELIVSMELCKDIEKLQKTGEDLAAGLLALGYTKSNFGAFFRVLDAIKVLADKASFIVQHSDTRLVPLCVQFSGKPAVGKSVCMQMLCFDLWDYYRKVINPSKKDEPYNTNMRYERNTADKFWSNYANQPFVTFDDYLQLQEKEKTNETLLDLIRIVNTNPYFLNQPIATDKGKVKFDSLAVLLTSNTDNHDNMVTPPTDLQDVNAFKGRRDFVFKVRVRDSAKKQGVHARDAIDASQVDAEEKKRLGELKDSSQYSRDVYLFEVFDPMTERPVLDKKNKPIVWTYLEMIAALCKRLKEKRQRKMQVAEFLKENPINIDSIVMKIQEFEAQMDLSEEGKERKVSSLVVDKSVSKDTSNPEKLNSKDFQQPPEFFCKEFEQKPREVTPAMRHIASNYSSDEEGYASAAEYIVIKKEEIMEKLDAVKCEAIHNFDSFVGYSMRGYAEAREAILGIEPEKEMKTIIGKMTKVVVDFVKEHSVGIALSLLTALSLVGTIIVIYKLCIDNGMIPQFNPASTGASHGLASTIEPLPKAPSKKRFVMVAQDSNAIDMLQTATRSNSARFTLLRDGARMSLNGVFVFHNVVMLPKHFVALFTPNLTLEICFFNGRDNVSINTNDLKSRVYDPENDLAFVAIPHLQPMKDIVKYFVDKQTLSAINVSRTSLLRYTVDNNGTHLPEIITSDASRLAGKTSYHSEGTQYTSIMGLEYVGTYRTGDCGSLVAIRNEFISQKLVGIHTAGNASKGRAAIITSDDLGYIKELFLPKLPTELPMDAHVHREAVDAEPVPHYVYNHWQILGNVPPHLATRFPSKTEIVPTPYQGIFTEPKKIPAALRPFYGKDGSVVSPLQKAINKWESPIPPILDIPLVAEITDNLFDRVSSKFPARVLTEHEAINGVVGARFLKMIDMSTSQGYTGYPQFGKSSKASLFDGTEFNYTPNIILRNRLNLLEESYLNDQDGVAISTMHLKDELRLIAKVEEGKTRGFGCPETAHFVKSKQYFGAYVENVGLEPAQNGIALGVNPCSNDWKELRNAAMRCKPLFELDGDSDTHDGKCHPTLVDQFIRGVNAWYKKHDPQWKPEHDKIRRGLMLDGTYKATILIGSDLVRPTRLIVSGVFLTFIFQSYTSHVIHRYCIKKACDKRGFVCTMKDLFQEMYILAGGDDYVHSISGKFSWYTFTIFQEEALEMGYRYTPPDKITDTYAQREVGKVEFLKRRFIERDGIMYAPLDIDTIQEIMNWKKRDCPNAVAFTSSAQSVLIEAFQHGQEVYNYFKNKLNMVAAHYGYPIMTLSYEYLFTQYGAMNYSFEEFEPQMFSVKDIKKPTSNADFYYKAFGKAPDVQYTQVGLQFTAQVQFGAHIFVSKISKSKAEAREDALAQLLQRFGVADGKVTKPQELIYTPSSFSDRFYHENGRQPDVQYVASQTYGFVCTLKEEAQVFTGAGGSKQLAREEALKCYYDWKKQNPFFAHMQIVKDNSTNPVLHAFDEYNIQINYEFAEDKIQFNLQPSRFVIYNEAYDLPNSNEIDGEFEPQMEAPPQEITGGYVEQQQLTTTRDTVVPETQMKISRFQLYTGTDPYPDQGLGAILSRKYRIGEVAWSGSDAVGTNLVSGNMPYQLLATSTILSDKILGFQWFRAGVNIELRVNGTQFHYGKVLVAWLPHNSSTGTPHWKIGNLYTASTCHALTLSASTNKSITFHIPYTIPQAYWPTTRHGTNTGDFGTYVMYVLNPLSLTNGTSTPTINISVFAQFVNPEVAGPTLNLSTLDMSEFVAQMEVNKEQDSKSRGGVISGVLNATSNIAAAVASIPLMNPIVTAGATLASGLAKGGALIAKAFGYDKPITTEVARFVHPDTFYGISNGNGLFIGQELGLTQGAHFANDPACLNEPITKTMLTELSTKPGLFAQFTFDATNAAGTVVDKHWVTPNTCYTTRDIGSTTFVAAHTPSSAIASMFKYWRGTMKYRLEIVCSKFVTGRIRISWHPTFGEIPALGSALGSGEGDIISEIIDFTGDTSFNFSIPYLQSLVYARSYDSVTKYEDGSSGGISVSIVNPAVTMQTTASTTVYCNWYVATDDDMSFHVLAEKQTGPAGMRSYITNFVFQSVLIAQMDVETNVLDDIFSKKFPSLITAVAKCYEKLSIAEDVSTFYHVLHKPTMIPMVAKKVANPLPLDSGTTLPCNRLDPTKFTQASFPLFLFFNWSMYYKGGFDHYIIPQSNGQLNDLGSFLIYMIQNWGSVLGDAQPNTYTTGIVASNNTPFAVQSTFDRRGLTVHQPYRSLLPYSSITQAGSYAFSGYNAEENAFAFFDTFGAETSYPIYWSFNVDDDFRFAWIVGPPGYTLQ